MFYDWVVVARGIVGGRSGTMEIIFVFERVPSGVCLGESVVFFFCGFEWLCFSLRESLVFSLDLLQHVVFLRLAVCVAKRPKRFAVCLSFFLDFNLNIAQVKKMYELREKGYSIY